MKKIRVTTLAEIAASMDMMMPMKKADLIAMLRDNEREFARHGIVRPLGPFSDPREVFTIGLPVDREPTPAELNARDAARYRWLRKHWKGRVAFDAIDSPEQFDVAVDAAKAEFGRALRARKT